MTLCLHIPLPPCLTHIPTDALSRKWPCHLAAKCTIHGAQKGSGTTSQNSREHIYRNHQKPTLLFSSFFQSFFQPTWNQSFQHHPNDIHPGLLLVGHGDLQPLDAALALPLYPDGTLAGEMGHGDRPNLWRLGSKIHIERHMFLYDTECWHM